MFGGSNTPAESLSMRDFSMESLKVRQLEAIQQAWIWFRQEGGDVSFAAVLAFARARCPDIAAECVRAEFVRRLKEARRVPRPKF